MCNQNNPVILAGRFNFQSVRARYLIKQTIIP